MKNFIYIFCVLLFSCQKYNNAPYDDVEIKLRKLPDTIDKMAMDSLWYKRDSLTYLRFKNIKLMYMEIDSIPNWIGEYRNLNFLSTTVDKRKFKVIPRSIGNLQKLSNLTLSNGAISTIPDELYSLEELQSLYLDDNKIDKISDNIKNLKKIKSIHLSDNPLIYLSQNICKLSSLQSLVLENTKIKDLPKCLGNLPNLDWINISGTNIIRFPIEILSAPKLKTIHANRLKFQNYSEVKAICEKRKITFYYDE